MVIALVVTPDGLPLAYEVLSGNTSDKTTLRDFLARIERQYGRARRVWLMDRGIPTEEVLAEMRRADPPVQYLVGTPKGRLNPHHCSRNRLEKVFISSCARKRDIEFRRCSWRSAVGVVGIRTVMPGVSNELGGRRVRGCLVWG